MSTNHWSCVWNQIQNTARVTGVLPSVGHLSAVKRQRDDSNAKGRHNKTKGSTTSQNSIKQQRSNSKMFELKRRDVAIILAHNEPRMCTEMYSSPQFCEVICASQLVLFSVRRSSPEAGGRGHYTAFLSLPMWLWSHQCCHVLSFSIFRFSFTLRRIYSCCRFLLTVLQLVFSRNVFTCVSTIITVYYSASIWHCGTVYVPIVR